MAAASPHLPVDALGDLFLINLHQLEDDVWCTLGGLERLAISRAQSALSALDGWVKRHEVDLCHFVGMEGRRGCGGGSCMHVCVQQPQRETGRAERRGRSSTVCRRGE